VNGLLNEVFGFESGQGEGIFIFSKSPYRLWDPFRLLFSEFQGYFTGVELPGRADSNSPAHNTVVKNE
jgi:hypothetical protein